MAIIKKCDVNIARREALRKLEELRPAFDSGKLVIEDLTDLVQNIYDDYIQNTRSDEFNTILSSVFPEVTIQYHKSEIFKVPQLVIKSLNHENYFSIFEEADSAYSTVINFFEHGIFKHCFLNTSRDTNIHYIKNASQFNNGIIGFKNHLVSVIAKRLGKEFKPVFDQQGCSDVNYYNELMRDAENNFLQSFNLQADIQSNLSDFEAFSTIYILNNFDTLVTENLDKIVQVSDTQKGNLHNANYGNDTLNNSTTYWLNDTHGDKDASKFVSNITKFIIRQIPKVEQFDQNGKKIVQPIYGKYLTTSDLFLISGVLKQAEYEWNILHPQNKISFQRNTKQALRTLLTSDMSLPVLTKFQTELLSLKTFLYDGTSTDFSVAETYREELVRNPKALDVEDYFAFEIGKTTAPSYISFNEDGIARVINDSQSYAATQGLGYQIQNLLYEEAENEDTILKNKVLSNPPKTVKGLKADPVIQEVFQRLFGVALNPNSTRFDQFLQENLEPIRSLLTKLHDAYTNGSQKLEPGLKEDTKIERIFAIYNSLSSNPSFIDLRVNSNKFFIDTPKIVFEDNVGNSIPVYRITSMFSDDSFLMLNYGELRSEEDAKRLNFLYANPNVFSSINQVESTTGKVTKKTIFNTDYFNSTAIKLDVGDGIDTVGANKVSVVAQKIISYIGEYLSLNKSEEKNPMASIQIACYSDKSSIMTKLLNLSAVINIENTKKKLKDALNPEDLFQLNYKFRKNSQLELMNSILEDWAKIEQALTGKTAIKFLSKEKLSQEYDNTSTLSKEIFTYWEHADQVIQTLEKKNVQKVASQLGIELCEELHYRKYSNGWGLNRAILRDSEKLSTTNSYQEYLDGLFDEMINSEFFYGGVQQKLYDIYKQLVKQNHDQDENFAKNLFNKSELNEPALVRSIKSHFLLENLIRNAYLDLSVKQPYLDPAKTSRKKLISGDAELSESFDAAQKRNVIMPGTVEHYSQGTLRGVSEFTKVAIIDDPRVDAWNQLGISDDLEAFNGVGWISPYQSRMEDASLVGKGTNGTKKTLGVYNSKLGSTLFKWAEFPLTNWMMRNSKRSNISLENVFRRMHNVPFSGDITKDFNGRQISITGSLGHGLYFKKGFNHYQVTSWRYNSDDDSYSFDVFAVDKNGKPVSNNKEVGYEHIKINTLYDLWKTLGGSQSEKIKDGELVFSEANHDFIYEVIVNHGEMDPNADETSLLDQTNVKQRLRDCFIGILANSSAIKRGQINLNPKETYYNNDEFSYFKIRTSLFGMQLDANHDADGEEIRETSQMVSALAALGYTQDQAQEAFEAIQTIISNNLRSYKALLNKDPQKLLHNLSEKIAKVVIKDSKINLAQAIIQNWDESVLPISDSNFYNLFLKEILSNYNREVVVRKYEGSANTLHPSAEVIQLYRIGDKSYLHEDLIKLRDTMFSDSEKGYLQQFLEQSNRNLNYDQWEELVNNLILYKLSHGNIDFSGQIPLSANISLNALNNVFSSIFINKIVTENVPIAQVQLLDWVLEDGKPKELKTFNNYVDFWTRNVGKMVTRIVSKPTDLRPQSSTWQVFTQDESKFIIEMNGWQTQVSLLAKVLNKKQKDIEEKQKLLIAAKETGEQIIKSC